MKCKRVVSLMLGLLAFVSLLPLAAAAETVDSRRECTLTVNLFEDSVPVEGFPFALYYVASVNAKGEFTLTGDFQGYPVEVNGLTQEQYTDLARTLDAYAWQDGLTPLDKKNTGSEGSAFFDRLTPGLYLVGGSSVLLNGRSLMTDPFLVALPSETADGTLSYEVIAQPKHIASEPAETPETVAYRVLKIWQGDVEEFRPAEITVHLLQDGRRYDTVRLTKAQSWRHTWENLPKYAEDGHRIRWQLTEEVPEGYRISIGREGTAFLLTNTYVPDNTTVVRRVQKRWDDAGFSRRRPSSVTVELLCDSQVYDTVVLRAGNGWRYVWENLPEKDSVGRLHTWTLREQAVDGYESAVWTEGDTFLVRNTYLGKKLPQTGQLWWPVSALSAGGLGLMILGLFLKKRQRRG